MAESFNTLSEILREREIPFDRDVLKAQFENPDSQADIQSWMQEYLSPSTLLTKEEAALYKHLEGSGEADTLAAAHDLSAIQGLEDREIRDAVEELKRSTAAIEDQTKALKMQQVALSVFVRGNMRSAQTRAKADQNQLRKWNVEKAQMSAAVEELAQSLKYQSTDLALQCKTAESTVRQTVDGILKADDKMLGSLQKLASDLEPGSVDDEAVVARIRELCARLIKHTVEGIRTKLDRTYLESLGDSNGTVNGYEKSQAEIDMQEELESLYSEILPVAQMSAEQQFLEPALREIAARDGQGQERSIKAVKYIDDCLTFLVNRLQAFLARAEEHQSHKMALKFVLSEANKELLRQDLAPLPTSTDLPTRRRRRSSASRRRRSSGFPDIEPEQQLLRNLGISLPVDADSDNVRIEILERALFDRSSKLDGHAKTLQVTTEEAISSHLLDSQLTLQLLRDALHANSPYGGIRMLDEEVRDRLDNFETELEEVQGKLEGVDLQRLFGRNVHKEQLIERWAR